MTPDSAGLSGPAHALLEAVTAISSDLDLHSVLTRIVEAAAQLTGARYAALGVVGTADDRGSLVEFVTTGLSDDERAQIGDLPRGRGVLGLLIDHPEAIRLHDITAHASSAGFPAHHPPMSTFLGVPVRVRGTVFGNLYLTEKEGGGDFTAQDEALTGQLARMAGFVIENARAYGLSERRRQWLEASAELADRLQPPVELDRALRLITESVRGVAQARAVAVVGEDDETVAADDADRARLSPMLDAVRNLPEHAPTDLEVDGWHAVVLPLRAHVAASASLVAVFDSAPAPHDVEERELLASFADQAALALDRAQAIVDREDLAVISDRERIARDLHDVVIQRLFATGLQLQGVALLAQDAEVTTRLEAAVDDLDTTIKAIRGTIFELQNKQASSLRATLRALAAEYAALLGFTPEVRTSGPVDVAVGPEVRDQLLPVVREALSNIARHARATRAEVDLAVGGGELRLCVSDDGTGLAETRRESGLANARRRAVDLGGHLDLTPREPRGTALTWRVPLSS